MLQMNLSQVCYKTNFISKVILRLDYSPILSLITNPPDKFQEMVRKEFPSTEVKDVFEITSGLKNGSEFIDKQVSKQYVFLNKEKTRQIEVNPAFLVILFSKYTSFEDFFAVVKSVIDLFKSFYSLVDIKRLGLRFVNEIRIPQGNPLEWKEFIDERLVANIDFYEQSKEKMNRVMTQMSFNCDEFLTRFNYGIFNVEYPNKISRREFILDYDCYSKNVTETTLYPLVEKFHSQIQTMFEMSIKENLRKIMG